VRLVTARRKQGILRLYARPKQGILRLYATL
jgi:hypothetical protein